ncbi:SGNH/GDSL hydrolase family protein [Streptomyces sp. NPDC018031]|uniref:SGNH/GDSL hydrolase family protein n=1 Tax=Streptomyces sp. NPDC018031 TaxID=3365033 RepID=UPI0037BA2317
MPMRRLARNLAVFAAAVGTSVLGLAAPTQAAETEPLRYTALGDSYSAGSGVLPLDLSTSPLCARSTRNYPNVIAERTGAELTDATCGGAQTKDFTQSQYPGVAPQLDALDADTELVTLTIGGNDNNTFIGAIVACGSAGVLTLGHGSPCKNIYGSHFTDQIESTTYPALKRSLAQVRQKAPNARVAVLGYPWILPATADRSCFLKMPIASGDVPYLRDLQTRLNRVIEKAAGEEGAVFVDLAAASEGHDACKPAGTRWVEPVLFGTNFVPVHPNALGEAQMATRTLDVLGLG